MNYKKLIEIVDYDTYIGNTPIDEDMYDDEGNPVDPDYDGEEEED